MSWLSDFYRQHPEYRRLRIAKRTRNSIHFEIEPGRYESHFLTRPMFERAASSLWLPVGNLAKAVRAGIAFSKQPRLAWEIAKALQFASTTDTFQPDAAAGQDTMIYSGSTSFNYGISATIGAGTYGNGAMQLVRGLLRIDVSSILSTETIDSATLTLYCESEQNTTDRTVGVHQALTQWYEGDKNAAVETPGVNGSTWRYRNENGTVAWAGGAGGGSGSDWAATATASVVITAPATAFNWNVQADVAAWVSGSATNYGWWLRNTNETLGNTLKSFTSSDGATAGNRPKLVVVHSTPAVAGRSFAVIVG